MKTKTLSLLLAAALLLSGCSNSPETAETVLSETTAAVTEIKETTVSETTAKTEKTSVTTTEITTVTTTETTSAAATETSAETEEPVKYPNAIWDGELPTMDGSTSAIPLETGIKAKLLGITWFEAKKLVNHNKTHISFGNLLNGDTDLIFSVPISKEQQEKADEMGVNLTFTPVAKEGFVFVVNADNPVDSLTQDQIRAIYSGEITNWKELGGNDEPITAFQRNYNSGSQNYMNEFMGEIPLADAPIEYVIGEMGGIISNIASFDYGTGAIGYSVYSYAAQMHADKNEIKLIAVDGVKPSKVTMADGSYPLSSCTYIITTDKADGNTRKFVDWAVSDEGQNCVLESGYLPVNNMEIPSDYLPYSAVGTGKKKPENYLPDLEFSYVSFSNMNGLLSALKDEELKTMISEDYEAAKTAFEEKADGKYNTYIYCLNGYLSIFLGKFYDEYIEAGYSECVSLMYDIVEKKRVEKFSDLFFEGENFVPVLNAAIQESLDNMMIWNLIKNDFSGYTGVPVCFGPLSVFLNKNNPYSSSSLEIGLYSPEIIGIMTTHEYRDMSECFVEGTNISSRFSNPDICFSFEKEDDYFYATANSVFYSDDYMKKLNEKLLIIQKDRAERIKIEANNNYDYYLNLCRPSIYIDDENNCVKFYVGFGEMSPWDMMYDLETCKIITPEIICGENWEQKVKSISDEYKNFEYQDAWVTHYNGDYRWISYIDINGKINFVALEKEGIEE